MFDGFPNPVFNTTLPLEVDTDFKAAGYEAFMSEQLKIINKQKQEVPFIPNPAQGSLNYFLERYLNVLILKARKMGFSSDALGIAVAKFILGKNENCVTMSFDSDAASRQLSRAKQFINSYQKINNTKIAFKYNRQNAMVYEAKDQEGNVLYTNTLRVGTAQSSSFGRGDDITYLHLTEVAFCDDVPTLLSGVGEACVDKAHKILETTANGFNSYKNYWDESVLGQTNFLALFYSPLWEYTEEYIEGKRRDLRRLGPQEYPMTPEEAFITSGDTYFEKDAMSHYLRNVREPIHA